MMKSKTPALTLSATAVLALCALSPAMAVDRTDLVHDARRLERSADVLMDTFIRDLDDRRHLTNRSPEAQMVDAIEHVQADVAKLVRRANSASNDALEDDVVHLGQVVARVRQVASHTEVDRRTRASMANMMRDYNRLEATTDRVVEWHGDSHNHGRRPDSRNDRDNERVVRVSDRNRGDDD